LIASGIVNLMASGKRKCEGRSKQPSGCSLYAIDLGPDPEGSGAGGSVLVGRDMIGAV
jgi:hypothetical protein